MPTLSIRTLLRNRWTWLALCYLLIPFTLRWLPLSGEIQYEFAAIVALLASILSAMVPLLVPDDRSTEAPPLDGTRLWMLALRTLPASLIPLGVYLLFVPFCEPCGFGDGILWYLILVLPSAAIGMMLGAAIASLLRGRVRRLLLFAGLWSLSLARGGFEALDGPHIFLYIWQAGFYPGGSWDAELPIPALLLLYRVWHILVALAIAALVMEIVRHRRGSAPRPFAVVLPALLAVVSLIAIPERAELGLTRTDGWLQDELGDTLHTRFATLYYNAPRADSLDIWRAANYADFHIRQQAAELGIPLDRVEPVFLYLYSSAAEQKRLVGTSSASFTKPWKRMIHLAFDRVTSTLEHELVHVMIEPFGNPLGVSLSQGLLEGSAVALDNDAEWRSIHAAAAALYRHQMAPPPARIMGVSGFTAQRSSVAYLIAGSFSRWLIDTHGIDRYLAAFGWGGFDRSYGQSLESLSDAYLLFIKSYAGGTGDQMDIAALRYFYGGGSFFYQRCLRRLGALNAEGFRALAEQRYDEALDRFGQSMQEGITYTARGGVLRALHAKSAFRSMLDSAAVYAQDTASYPLLPFLVEQGDARWALGDSVGAVRHYDSVDRLQLGLSTATRVALRRFFLLDSARTRPPLAGSGVSELMRGYFSQSMSPLQRIELLDQAMRGAGRPDQIVVLALMKATLLAPALPRTAAAIVRSVAGSIESAPQPATGYLLHGLRDALLYEALLSRRDIGALPLDDGYSGPEPELSEIRKRESERFREFLRGHAILP